MSEHPEWKFLTSHGSVLLEVASEPNATVREIAERAGLTERQAHRVLADLVAAGYLQRQRVGRRNRYSVDDDLPMRHPSFSSRRVGELISALRG